MGDDVQAHEGPRRRPARRLGPSVGVALTVGLLLLAAGPAAAARGGRAAHQARLASAQTTIVTMPPVPGAVFLLSNGLRFTADARGAIQVPTLVLGAFRGHAGPAGMTVPTVHFRDGGRAELDGWYGTHGGTRPLTAAFSVYRPFTLKFLGTGGHEVNPKTIDRVTLKGSTGGVTTLDHNHVGTPHLFQTEHVVSRQGGPYVSPIQYRIKNVYISGTNVVRSLKESFYVDYEDKLPHRPTFRQTGFVDLIFYRATFSVRDTLLPHAIGSGIILTFPDGSKREYAFTSPGEVTIPALPRGKYLVGVDAPGFGFSRPLTLTRDQDVKLQVISYIDLAIVGVLLSGIVIGLVVVRRPHLLGMRRRAPKATP